MKNNKTFQYLLTSIILCVFGIYGCNKYDEPALINNPNQNYSSSPEITGILPADSAAAGVREITILGHNFPAANSSDTNWVYIGGSPAKLKSVTPDAIVLYRPTTSGRGLTIDVVVPKSLKVAQKANYYNIETPVAAFGDYKNSLVTTYALNSIEVDNDENVYVGSKNKIYKQTPDGLYITTWATLSPSEFSKILDIKFGPGGLLYATTGTSSGSKNIYSFNPLATDNKKGQKTYVSLPKSISVFDFDGTGGLYAAKKDGIYYADAQKNITPTNRLVGTELIQIRVTSNYVYSLSAQKLYRNKISSDNKAVLEDEETLVDLSSQSGFASTTLTAFAISADGAICVSVAGHPEYSLFALENGALVPFYVDNILPNSIDRITWGSGRYLYFLRDVTNLEDRVFRMGMDRTGASYFGRGLN